LALIVVHADPLQSGIANTTSPSTLATPRVGQFLAILRVKNVPSLNSSTLIPYWTTETPRAMSTIDIIHPVHQIFSPTPGKVWPLRFDST
jgi:hypothetical protein